MRIRSHLRWLGGALTVASLFTALLVMATTNPAHAACGGSGQADDDGGSASGHCDDGGPPSPTPVSTSGSAETCDINGQTGTVRYRDDGPVDPNSQVGNPSGDGSIGIPYGTDAHWYFKFCDFPDGSSSPIGPVVLPVGAAGAPIDPTVLRDAARAQITPSAPTIGMAPSGTDKWPAVVQDGTWLWIAGPWQPMTATQSEGTVTVTVTAKPKLVTWSMGDGKTETCDGPGTAYHWTGAPPPEYLSKCKHVYTRVSAHQPDSLYHGTATITWAYTWTLNGADQGSIGESTSPPAPFTLKVVEIQVLNDRPGGAS